MATYAGPAPWSAGFKRTNKATRERAGIDWSLSRGYRQRNEWDEKPGKPKTKKVRLFNGRTVEVPDADFEDFMGHWVSPPSDPESEVGKYIDKAFENLDKIQAVDGVGHITYIEYSPTYQLLRVEFATDSAVVVFFRVPKEVYSELYYLAISGAKRISAVDGEEHHVLGMKFWDIVRIRGQRTGSRYRFEYAIEGSYEPKVRPTTPIMPTANIEAAAQKAAEYKQLLEHYDYLASRLLSESKLNTYNRLTNLSDKEVYLKKVGII